jgi:hypothetical protein
MIRTLAPYGLIVVDVVQYQAHHQPGPQLAGLFGSACHDGICTYNTERPHSVLGYRLPAPQISTGLVPALDRQTVM